VTPATAPSASGIKTSKVADQREFTNCLYYGEGGTGKTTALASLANLGRVLYVDAESGIKRHPLERLGVNVGNIEKLEFDDTLSFAELEDAFWTMKRDLETDPDSWAGVVWDSGTEIYHALLDSLVGKRVEKADRATKSGRGVADVMSNRFFIDRDDYGVMSEQVRFLLRRFRDLPCHFGIAFLERRDQDPGTGTVRIGPAITPGLQSDVIGWHDIVCRTSFDSDANLFLGTFRPEGVRQGKDRFGMLPPHMVNPSVERVVGYITGRIEPGSDEEQDKLTDGKEATAATDDDTETAPAPAAKLTSAQRIAASRAAAKKS
jgi:predicted ATPase